MNKDKRDLLTLAILSYAKRATRDQKSPEGTKRALGIPKRAVLRVMKEPSSARKTVRDMCGAQVCQKSLISPIKETCNSSKSDQLAALRYSKRALHQS